MREQRGQFIELFVLALLQAENIGLMRCDDITCDEFAIGRLVRVAPGILAIGAGGGA
ncbi:MAG: hypothetical protein M9963_05780 [Kiritimatiellae bacterium]|nr:hypothetical protein [Kiritimatiellia bacterium]